MRANPGMDTKPELALRSAVHRLGLRYRKHCRPLPDLRCIADFGFHREKVAVFVDGCFWHGCPVHGSRPTTNTSYWSSKIERNQERDRRNGRRLAAAGWRVVRVWEHEAPEVAASRVAAAVLERRSGGA